MQLSKEAIQKFKQIYRTEFGKEISDQEALEKGINLFNLFRIIYREIPVDRKNKDPLS